MMAAFGLTEDQIAQFLYISKPTLRRHYRHELDVGHVKANVAVANNLFRLATKDDIRAFPAARFWLTCRGGWRETNNGSGEATADSPAAGKKEQASAKAAAVADSGGVFAPSAPPKLVVNNE